MKWMKLLSITLFASLFLTLPSYGQEVKKTVKIVTKKIDANGNEVVEEKYAEGEEAEQLLKEMDIDVEGGGQVRVEIETDSNGKKRKTVRIETEEKEIRVGGDENKELDIKIDQAGKDDFTLRMNRDGKEEFFHWEGLENLPEELERMLEDMDVKLHLEEMDFGDIGDFEMKEFNFPSSLGRAALGVRIEESETAAGAKIIEISDGSAAEKAGLKEGDIITAINGIPIEEVNDLIRKISKYEPQERIEVDYQRNGKSKTAKVVLKERAY